ncbi:MAG: pantetheine-phosphate adenylyltransferase [Anaerolineales bacterium]
MTDCRALALYPGSFDPIHHGHVDIARRAAALFDCLIVGVYVRPEKDVLFPAEERVALAHRALQDIPNVQVCSYDGLTVDFAYAHGVQVLVRGLRVISDFEMEYQMALTNQKLCPEVDTVCLMTNLEHAFLSSSVVKEICMAGGDISDFVPPPVAQALQQKCGVNARP